MLCYVQKILKETSDFSSVIEMVNVANKVIGAIDWSLIKIDSVGGEDAEI